MTLSDKQYNELEKLLKKRKITVANNVELTSIANKIAKFVLAKEIQKHA